MYYKQRNRPDSKPANQIKPYQQSLYNTLDDFASLPSRGSERAKVKKGIFNKYSPAEGNATEAAIHSHGDIPHNNFRVALDDETRIQYLTDPGMIRREAVGRGGFQQSISANYSYNQNQASQPGDLVANYQLKSLYYRNDNPPLWKTLQKRLFGEANTSRFLWDQVAPSLPRGKQAAGTKEQLDQYYQKIANITGKDIYVVLQDTDFNTLYSHIRNEKKYSTIYAVHCRGCVDPTISAYRLRGAELRAHLPIGKGEIL